MSARRLLTPLFCHRGCLVGTPPAESIRSKDWMDARHACSLHWHIEHHLRPLKTVEIILLLFVHLLKDFIGV